MRSARDEPTYRKSGWGSALNRALALALLVALAGCSSAGTEKPEPSEPSGVDWEALDFPPSTAPLVLDDKPEVALPELVEQKAMVRDRLTGATERSWIRVAAEGGAGEESGCPEEETWTFRSDGNLVVSRCAESEMQISEEEWELCEGLPPDLELCIGERRYAMRLYQEWQPDLMCQAEVLTLTPEASGEEPAPEPIRFRCVLTPPEPAT